MKILKIAVIIFLLNTYFIYSENIRGPVVKIIDSKILSDSENSIEFNLSPEELFAVSPDYSKLPDKISIEIRSTETIKRFRDSFSLYSYTDVSPDPQIDRKSYTGRYAQSALIPDRTRYFIDIILNSSYKNTNTVKGTKIIDYSSLKNDRPLMFTILPVMKGVPDYLLSEKFKIKIKTFWPEQGQISLKVFGPVSSNNEKSKIDDFSLTIDGKTYNSFENIVLNTGIHSISVSKKGYMTHKENITVKTNEKRSIDIILKSDNPLVSVFSPDESDLFIDGKIQNSKNINTLSPGEHTFVFKLGDYSLSRTILLEEGKKYSINLLLDIEVKEE